MGIFPKVRGDKKRYLSCHHLVIIDQQRTKPSLSQKAVRFCFCFKSEQSLPALQRTMILLSKVRTTCVNSKKRCWYQKCTQPAYTQNSQNNNLRMHVWLLMQVLKQKSWILQAVCMWHEKSSNSTRNQLFDILKFHLENKNLSLVLQDPSESAFWAGFLGSFYTSWKGIRSTRVSTIYIFKTETWGYAFKEKNWCLNLSQCIQKHTYEVIHPTPHMGPEGLHAHYICYMCIL